MITEKNITFYPAAREFRRDNAAFAQQDIVISRHFRPVETDMSNEHHIAILMADLTGYTAMTEAHGALTAASIVQKYIHLAQNALTGNARLLERVGDQLVLVAENPDDLACTAIRLLECTGEESNFLAVHGGLHYGPVIEQAGSYFGSSMNLTARIAAKAKRNTMLCSAEFIGAINNIDRFTFTEPETMRFKNIKAPVQVAALLPGPAYRPVPRAIDPVWHMEVDLNGEHTLIHNGELYHFCSEDCLQVFQGNPDDVLQMHHH